MKLLKLAMVASLLVGVTACSSVNFGADARQKERDEYVRMQKAREEHAKYEAKVNAEAAKQAKEEAKKDKEQWETLLAWGKKNCHWANSYGITVSESAETIARMQYRDEFVSMDNIHVRLLISVVRKKAPIELTKVSDKRAAAGMRDACASKETLKAMQDAA
ncbi:hypothetical protein CJP72_12365 [Citrobacter sp. NCU1]|uniref:hypothetical protein n=1 Tax=Citrobacter sp. NCU1 TaxID=2026683 RepID=UPI001390A2AE|nr:hypothetical protein [Citrobacter sp. NCU1]NDO81530.1 hypothetical protein [Citrobacter sp. NCU1]